MNEFKSWNSYGHFARRVRREARFIRTVEDKDFLRQVLSTSKQRIFKIPEACGLWRAQLGHDWRPCYVGGEYITDDYAPHPPERMKPIQGRATEGRANPKGIPVLYLSNERKTAMSEVRPWMGSLVSCAHFEIIRPLRIVDLSVHHQDNAVSYLFGPEPDVIAREKAVWTQIDQAFSEPMTSADDVADYVPTQVIAELFKVEGYDGIAYKSTFEENGYNIALFNPDDAKLTCCSLYRAKSLEFSFEEVDDPYWIKDDNIRDVPE
ncbi:MAG: RES family NAD+ phosphorylase [Gammaproteobacteria bacterium]|nr:RES family NAD+ phosphorylase [Gammaproteobacteria bacterium]MYD77314.1 RES family NAD+ phosphorylase [Gammaproteobacteria bacterium]